MRTFEVTGAACLAAVLVSVCEPAWGFNLDDEQRGLALAGKQVDSVCGTTSPSDSRVAIGLGLLPRLDAHLSSITQEIASRQGFLNQYNFPAQAVAAQLSAQHQGDLAATQAELKRRQFDLDTAIMYRRYSPSGVFVAQRALAQTRARLAALLQTDGNRAPASAEVQARVAEVTSQAQASVEDLTQLADLGDHYQTLRNNLSYCLHLRKPDVDPVTGVAVHKAPSIDPLQNFPEDEGGGTAPSAGKAGP